MKKTELSDEELVEKIKEGSIELFEIIVHRYQKRLVNYIFRMINDYETALELSQEIFVKVYGALQKFTPTYKFNTWIYRVAANATIDWLRKKRYEVYSLDSSGDDGEASMGSQIPSTDPNPYQHLEMGELQERIDQAINELPLMYKQLIVLRHINELSYEEIALAVDLPQGTVKNRIFRGREMIKAHLAADARGGRNDKRKNRP